MAMASKAKFLERDLKSIRGDLCFMRERCAFLEEENRRLRDAVAKGVRPEEDDLVCYGFAIIFFIAFPFHALANLGILQCSVNF
jgi:hypothetical protein